MTINVKNIAIPLGILGVSLIIPVVINFAFFFQIIPTKFDSEQWLEFWSSYIGGPCTLVAVIISQIYRDAELRKQHDLEKERFQKELFERDISHKRQIENNKIQMDYMLREKYLSDLDEMTKKIQKSENSGNIQTSRGHLAIFDETRKMITTIYMECHSETLKRDIMEIMKMMNSGQCNTPASAFNTSRSAIFKVRETYTEIFSKIS